MQDFHQKIRINAIYLLLQKLTTPAINLLLTIYIVNKLSIADYGIYNIIYAVIGYLSLYSSLGILNVLQRYIPEFYAQGHYSGIKSLFLSTLVFRFILTIIFLALLIWFAKPVGKFFKVDDLNIYLELFSLGIILFLEIQIVELTLGALLQNRAIMFSYFIAIIFRASLVYWFLSLGYGLTGLLRAETIYYAALLITQLAFYFYDFAAKNHSEKQKLPLKRLLRYSGLSYLDELGWTVLDVKTDYFVISNFLGPTMVGLYAFANQVIETVAKLMPDKMIRPLIRTAFFSKFSEHRDLEKLNENFNLLVKLIAFISFPLFSGIIVLSDKIIVHFYDAKYLPAQKLIWMFTAFLLIISFQYPMQLVVQAIEKVEITFYSKIFSIYNLVGEILVIQSLGLMGVALATCSARLFQTLFIFNRIRRHVPIKIAFRPLLKILFNSLVMMVFLLVVRGMIISTLSLIVILTGALVTYLVMSYFNKSFLIRERILINQLLPRPVFVF